MHDRGLGRCAMECLCVCLHVYCWCVPATPIFFCLCEVHPNSVIHSVPMVRAVKRLCVCEWERERENRRNGTDISFILISLFVFFIFGWKCRSNGSHQCCWFKRLCATSTTVYIHECTTTTNDACTYNSFVCVICRIATTHM